MSGGTGTTEMALPKDLDIHALRSERISKASHLITTEGGRLLLKLEPPWGSLGGLVSRLLVGGSIPFRAEIAVNRLLAEKRLPNFRCQPLVKTDGASYLLFEFVPGREGWDRERVSKDAVVSALVEFQTAAWDWRRSWIEEGVARVLERAPWKIVRAAFGPIRKRAGLAAAWKCLSLCLRCAKRQGKLATGVLLHNDLGPNNLVTGDDGRLYFLDFEDAILERRWILGDIVDLAFSAESLTVDKDLLAIYLGKLRSARPLPTEFDVRAQMRIALVRRVTLGLISRKLSEQDKGRLAAFLRDTLLPDSAYEAWYSEYVGL